METLIKKNEASRRWYPQSVEAYKSGIKISYNTSENKRLSSNFAYNMQYIEYIEKQLDELNLSNVLITMLYKSYIVTGMGIIEMLFVYLLKKTGFWNRTEWEECATYVSNIKDDNGIVTKVESKLYKRVTSYEVRMDLDSMIKKIEKKCILTIDHNVFPALKKLRELRNRVHLQVGDGAYDHDYNNIGFEEIQMMRRILYSILTTPEICNDVAMFEFINACYTKRLRVE